MNAHVQALSRPQSGQAVAAERMRSSNGALLAVSPTSSRIAHQREAQRETDLCTTST